MITFELSLVQREIKNLGEFIALMSLHKINIVSLEEARQPAFATWTVCLSQAKDPHVLLTWTVFTFIKHRHLNVSSFAHFAQLGPVHAKTNTWTDRLSVYLHEIPVFSSPWNQACYVMITFDHFSPSMIDNKYRHSLVAPGGGGGVSWVNCPSIVLAIPFSYDFFRMLVEMQVPRVYTWLMHAIVSRSSVSQTGSVELRFSDGNRGESILDRISVMVWGFWFHPFQIWTCHQWTFRHSVRSVRTSNITSGQVDFQLTCPDWKVEILEKYNSC